MEADELTPPATLSSTQKLNPPLTLDSMPVEIVAEILGHVVGEVDKSFYNHVDNLKVLYNVARTCKRLNDILQASLRSILSPVGYCDVPHFDLALTAVRATNLVETALKADQLVRQEDMFPLENLSGQARPPTLAELGAVLELQHFGSVAAFTTMGVTDARATTSNSWSLRCYRNLYRLTICGAALSSAYLEPFFQMDVPRPAGFLDRILSDEEYKPTSSDREYFDQFPLYRVITRLTTASSTPSTTGQFSEDVEAIFKPVAIWLLQEMAAAKLEAESEAESKALPSPFRWPIHRQLEDAKRLTRELAQRVETDRWGNGILVTPPGVCRLLPGSRRLPLQGGIRTVKAVRYGVFRPERLVTTESKETRGNRGTRQHMSRAAYARVAQIPNSQATKPTVCERLFDGLYGSVLSLESVFDALQMRGPAGLPHGENTPPGLLTYMGGLEETQPDEEFSRLDARQHWEGYYSDPVDYLRGLCGPYRSVLESFGRTGQPTMYLRHRESVPLTLAQILYA